MRLFFRKQNADDETLFSQINAYLMRVRQREQRALLAEHYLKQCLQILNVKPLAYDEYAITMRAKQFAQEQEHARHANI